MHYCSRLLINFNKQGVVLQASTRNPIEIVALSPVNNNQYEAFPRVNKRGSEEDREQISQKELSTIKFEQPNRKPFWIALDEVQDPQVRIFFLYKNHELNQKDLFYFRI